MSAPEKSGAMCPTRGLCTCVASWGVRVARTTPTMARTEKNESRHPAGRMAPPAGPRHAEGAPLSTGTVRSVRDRVVRSHDRPGGRGAELSDPFGPGSAPRSGTGHHGRGGRDGVGGPAARSGDEGEKPSQPDQQAAGPQPGQQRLDDHPDGHGSGGQVRYGRVPRRVPESPHLVEGQVDVAEGARVDGRRPDGGECSAEVRGGRREDARRRPSPGPRPTVFDGVRTVRSPTNSNRCPL